LSINALSEFESNGYPFLVYLLSIGYTQKKKKGYRDSFDLLREGRIEGLMEGLRD